MLNRSRIRLLVLLSTVLVTVTNASPTANDSDERSAVCGVSLAPDVCDRAFFCSTGEIAEATSLNFGHLADGLLAPPAVYAAGSPSFGVKSLPAVPKTLLMVVTGFLCVSLVKDRRVWLSVVAALLWLGQAGLTTLPQLAWHLLGKKHVPRHAYQNIYSGRGLDVGSRLHVSSARTDKSLSEAAIISAEYLLDPHLKSLVLKTRQPICFSPAQIFDTRPRGPPLGG